MEYVKTIKFGKTEDDCLAIWIPASTSVSEVRNWIKKFLELAKPQVGDKISIDYTLDENSVCISIVTMDENDEEVNLINFESTIWDDVVSLESVVVVLQCCYINEAEEYEEMLNVLLDCMDELNNI